MSFKTRNAHAEPLREVSSFARPEDHTTDACLALWSAVLRLGVQDAVAEMKRRAARKAAPLEPYRGALYWFYDDRDNGPGSFVRLCNLFDMNPETARSRVLARRRAIASELSDAPVPAYKYKPANCVVCGVMFAKSSSTAKYCSPECRETGRADRLAITRPKSEAPKVFPPRPCPYCGETFTPGGPTQKFCTVRCRVRATALTVVNTKRKK